MGQYNQLYAYLNNIQVSISIIKNNVIAMLIAGAVPQCQKDLEPLPPCGGVVEGEDGGVVEGEGEDRHVDEGRKQGGGSPQGPRARC